MRFPSLARLQMTAQGRPVPVSRLLVLLGTLSLAAYVLGFYAVFPLQRYYVVPLLDLNKLAGRNPQAWFGVALAIILLNLAYLAGYRLLQTSTRPVPWALLLVFPMAACVVLFFTYPVGAADLFDYLARGYMTATHGANPYLTVPAAVPGDPFTAYAAWRAFPSAYGPLWELLAAPLAALAQGNLWRGVLVFKAAAVLSFLLTVLLVARLAQGVDAEPAATQLAVYLVAWNPLLLFEIVANAHHDLWMVLAILLAVLATRGKRYWLALPALALGALLKFVPLLVVPLIVLAALRDLGWRRGLAQAAAGLALSAALAFACYAPFWPISDPLRLVQRDILFTTSLPAVARYLLALRVDTSTAQHLAGQLARLLLAAGLGLSLLRVWLAPRPVVWRVTRDFLTGLLLLATAWFQAWYLAWVLPLAALAPRSKAVRGLLLLSVTAWFKYLLFGLAFMVSRPRVPVWQQEVTAFLFVLAIPIIWHARLGIRLGASLLRGRRTGFKLWQPGRRLLSHRHA